MTAGRGAGGRRKLDRMDDSEGGMLAIVCQVNGNNHGIASIEVGGNRVDLQQAGTRTRLELERALRRVGDLH